jgi:hypothetical protein
MLDLENENSLSLMVKGWTSFLEQRKSIGIHFEFTSGHVGDKVDYSGHVGDKVDYVAFRMGHCRKVEPC